MIGQMIAHYRINAKIGEGGMGAVYRATDTKLNREVAIKVLPEAFAGDPDRMLRFRREAQVLAALNHPNIATIYGVEDRAIIMEYIAGRPLSGPLAVAEMLPLARQMADAIEAAHEKGITHRDLKPANVLVTADGVVKVLDFGLATPPEPVRTGDPSTSPTLTITMGTQAGMILGTASYMSPEQARAQPVDRRADIWSFGVVLFETLTGKRLFLGETTSDTLAEVLAKEIPWSGLPAGVPGPVRELIARCLMRDRKQRMRDIGEARIAIDRFLANPQPAEAPATLPPPRRSVPAILIGGVAALSAASGFVARELLNRTPEAPKPVRRFRVSLAPIAIRSEVQVARNGSRVLFLGSGPGNRPALYVANLDGSGVTRLESTYSIGGNHALSPDGALAASIRDGQVQITEIGSGSSRTTASNIQQISHWTADGRILARSMADELVAIPANGGAAQTIFRGRGLTPSGLPGGKHFLLSLSRTGQNPAIAFKPYDNGEPVVLSNIEGYNPSYLPSGHLLYRTAPTRDAVRLIVPFDPRSLRVTGAAAAIEPCDGFAVDDAGNAVRVVRSRRTARLIVTDRAGKALQEINLPEPFNQVRVSPNGKTLLLGLSTGDESDIWSYDLERGVRTRLTDERGEDERATWAADGKRYIYMRQRTHEFVIRNADGSPGEKVIKATGHVHVEDWSPDGKNILSSGLSPENIRIQSLDGGDPKPLAPSAHNQANAAFSPAGNWVAYESNESGLPEVYVRPFPGPGGRIQISNAGGSAPRWARNGREIYYRLDRGMFAVPVAGSETLNPGKPVKLFEREFAAFDVLPSGGFVFFDSAVTDGNMQFDVILNWSEEAKRMAPFKG